MSLKEKKLEQSGNPYFLNIIQLKKKLYESSLNCFNNDNDLNDIKNKVIESGFSIDFDYAF